jgi:hypothetical protein
MGSLRALLFGGFMSSKPHVFIALCDGCRKVKYVHLFGQYNICNDCEDKFYDDMLKQLQSEEYGQDIVRDEKFKKKD